ncbi:hypothetical protein HJC10_00380 [Corallococcus exiguus]|uniref:hypothetical protein n=1 Tax=Corallococcus exiguus TaxID=83462 RepID=UPI001470CB52|nr:hypothetical protein [Corallococcus exiguus]NNB92501.1 hypothetical protein [Corallococcus exiguus]NNC01319.1 hypothetical protein [Corallococcus exiguus]
MALRDLIRPAPPPPTPAAERPPGITCEKYTRGEGKRCLHFQQGGTCLLPDEFVCTEWQKHNGPNKRTLPAVAPAPVLEEPPAPKPVAHDLFGNPLPEVATPAPAPNASPPAPMTVAPRPDADATPAVDVDQLHGFTTDNIESFKALGVEVLLRSETYGDVWLVPAYTGRDRKEITPEHAATLARVMSVFPASHIVSFEKIEKTNPNTPERPERPSRRS